MSQENVDYVRRSREALNRGDLDGFLSIGSADHEWVIAQENPNARTLRGRDEIAAYFRDWTDTMTNLRYIAAEDIDAGHAVVTLGTVSGQAGEDGPEVSVQLAIVSYFDNGIAVRTEEYLDPRKALEAVGLSEQDARG